MDDPYCSPAIVKKYLATETPLSGAEWDFLTSHLDKEASLCDVGFGSGGLLSQLLENGYRNLSGIDFSPPFVAHAQARFGEKVRIVQADLTEVEPDQRFDAVIAYHLITAIQQEAQRNRVLCQVARLVHPAGLLITKSFWSTVDKTVRSTQEGVDLNIWIPRDEDFRRSILTHGFQWIDSTTVEKDGFQQAIHVFRKG